MDVQRWNRLHPTEKAKVPYITEQLSGRTGPVIASTDYVKTYTDQLRPFVPARYETLGADGFGRSDNRAQLRSHFEIDRYHVVVAALKALADEGTIPAKKVADAIKQYKIDADSIHPLYA